MHRALVMSCRREEQRERLAGGSAEAPPFWRHEDKSVGVDGLHSLANAVGAAGEALEHELDHARQVFAFGVDGQGDENPRDKATDGHNG